MDKVYYDAVSKMEEMNVEREYQLGWMAGYLQNPEREEQRLTDAYKAGAEDGAEKDMGNFGNWVAK